MLVFAILEKLEFSMPKVMCIRRAEPVMSSDEIVQSLTKDVEVHDKKDIACSVSGMSIHTNLMVRQQPEEVIHEHLKLLINKLRTKPSVACLDSIKCYLELGKCDVYRQFVENGGFRAIGDSFERMSTEERRIACSIAAVFLSKDNVGPVSELARSISRLLSPEMLEILCLCAQRTTLSFVFEGGYLEWFLGEVIRRGLGKQAAVFLIALNAKSKPDQRIIIRYLLVKTDFLKRADCAESLAAEIRRTAHCRPVLSSAALDDRLRGILEIVESLGLCNFIVFILEGLLFEPDQFLRDAEERFIRPVSSEKRNKADGQEHSSTCRSMGNDTGQTFQRPGMQSVKTYMGHTSAENTRYVERGRAPFVGSAGASRTVARGPPKRRSVKKDTRREVPDLSKFQESYMPIRWEKVSAERSVWKFISAVGVEALFDAEDLLPFVKPRQDAKEKHMSSVQVHSVFDAKKNNAMNIVLCRVKHTDAELKHMILRMELQDENLVRQLLHNFPTDEELEALEKRERGFGRAEEFFKECIGATDQLKDALNSMHFISVLGSQSVSSAICVLERFYRSVMESKAFLELLRILLFLGNVLNSNTALGSADGFSLSDMGMFARLRGKNRDSVLDLALSKLSLRNELRKDLELLSAASQIGLDGVDQDMCEIRNCRSRVRNVENEKVAVAMDEYAFLAEKYENFKILHGEFETFVGTKANSELYASLSDVYKEL